MTNEPLLDEIRQVRHAISEEIGHDPHKIVAYYAKLQQEHRDRIASAEKKSQSAKVTPTTH